MNKMQQTLLAVATLTASSLMTGAAFAAQRQCPEVNLTSTTTSGTTACKWNGAIDINNPTENNNIMEITVSAKDENGNGYNGTINAVCAYTPADSTKGDFIGYITQNKAFTTAPNVNLPITSGSFSFSVSYSSAGGEDHGNLLFQVFTHAGEKVGFNPQDQISCTFSLPPTSEAS